MKTLSYFKKSFTFHLFLMGIIMSACASHKFDYNSAYKFSHHNYSKTVVNEGNNTAVANSLASDATTESTNFSGSKSVLIVNNEIVGKPKSNNLQQNDLNNQENNISLVETQTNKEKNDIVKEKEAGKTKSDKKVFKIREKFRTETPEPDPSKNWAAIASLPVGIVSLLVAGVLLGPTAIVFGAIGLKSEKKGLAIAGFVIGIIGFIGALIFISSL